MASYAKNLLLAILLVRYGGVPPIMGLDANLVVFAPMLVLVVAGLILSFRDDEK